MSILAQPIVTIHTFSLECIGSHLVGPGGTFIGEIASATYRQANLAHYFPFYVSALMRIKQMWWHNGATVSGNVDAGVYDEKGVRIVSTGSTAQSGTNVIQAATAEATIGPGVFYMALAMDNTTGTIFRAPVSLGMVVVSKATGALEEASAFPLPAVATFAAYTVENFPYFGLSIRTI